MISKLFRKGLGKKFFKLAIIYRSFFVNLGLVASAVSEFIPSSALVIDIGGGDGMLLNWLLQSRKDICVNMLDIANNIGCLLRFALNL